MARSFTGRHVVAPRYKRATFWGRSPENTTVIGLASATALLDSSAVPLVQGETIIRVRGTLWITPDTLAATENSNGALGFCIVMDQALAVGVGSIPTPYSDQDSELWFVHQYWATRNMKQTDVGFSAEGFQRVDFDSKAMRKLPSGSSLAVVIENGNSGAGVSYYLNYAVFFKVK